MVIDDLSINENKMRITFLTHKRAILIAISGGNGLLNPLTGIYEKPISESYRGKAAKIAEEYGFTPIITTTFSKAISILEIKDDIIGVITCDWLDDAPDSPISRDPKGKDLAKHSLNKGIPSVVVCPDRFGGADLLFSRKRGFGKKKIGMRYLPERTSFWREVVTAFIFRTGTIKKKS